MPGRLFRNNKAKCGPAGETAEGRIPHAARFVHTFRMALQPQGCGRFVVKSCFRRLSEDARLRQTLFHIFRHSFTGQIQIRHRQPDTRIRHGLFPFGNVSFQRKARTGILFIGFPSGATDGFQRPGNP